MAQAVGTERCEIAPVGSNLECYLLTVRAGRDILRQGVENSRGRVQCARDGGYTDGAGIGGSWDITDAD